MHRRTFILSAPLALAACGGTVLRDEPMATMEEVNRVAYRDPGPAYLELITMRNTGSDNGAHTGLLINASQRVLWDPAGTFGHPSIPERGDVHFGINPEIYQYYISYHSRITYYTVLQRIIVPDAVAEQALQLAMANGPTPKAFCTTHTSRALAQLPGFGSIRRTIFPDNLARRFGALPGVQEREYRETDSGDLGVAREELNRTIAATQQ